MAEERSSVSAAQLVRPAEAVAKPSAKASLPSRKAKRKASSSGVDAGGAASGDAAAVLSSPDPAATVPGVVAAKTSAIGTLAITVPVQVNSFVPPDGGRAGSECRSFSQLLAGAMASPAENSRASPILTVPVDGTRLPVVAVPCIIAPAALLESPGFTGQFAMTHQAVLATVTAQAQMQLQSGCTQPAILPSHVPIQQIPLLTSSDKTSSTAAEQPPSLDQKLQIDQVVSKTISTDGYNWRKYGQKQVKSGDNFRSYYKCTQAGCFAKKKVERSQVGHVVEVIYRSEHNHDPPERTKCSKEKGPQPNIPSGDNETSTIATGYVAGGFGLSPAKISNGCEHNKYAPKAAGYPMERGPPSGSPSRDKEMSSPASTDENGAEVSPNKMDQKPASDVPGSQLQNLTDCKSEINNKYDDHYVSRPDPKRRQIESSLPSPSSFVKSVKETKVVVQMASEMGLVSDGYRWRKYGQKIVKGNPNPRSYYRCTQIGCLVRKHVERDSTDARALIVTYEGKHNHGLPTPKNEGDIPVLLSPAAADREAKAASSSADQHSKDEPSKAPDEKMADSVGDKTLESAETLLSMSAAKEGDEERKNSDAIQRPQNCAPVPV